MWLACTELRMTVEETWRAVTVVAARAALLEGSGSLVAGSRCDLVVWAAAHPAEIAQHDGVPLAARVAIGGEVKG